MEHLRVAREGPQLVRDEVLEAVRGGPHDAHRGQDLVAHAQRAGGALVAARGVRGLVD